jgi:hypothetical protein
MAIEELPLPFIWPEIPREAVAFREPMFTAPSFFPFERSERQRTNDTFVPENARAEPRIGPARAKHKAFDTNGFDLASLHRCG